MAVPIGRPNQCRQPVPSSLLHHYVQRSGMVRFLSTYWLLPYDANNPYSDYINPIDLCNRLNTYIVPEAAVHAFLTVLFVINGYWLAILLNLPLLLWNGKK